MNKYLEKIAQSNSGNDARNTAIIGGTGIGATLATSHITDRMGLNGVKAAPKTTGSILSRASEALKDPVSSIKSAISSPGFKRGAKIGAVGGAVGLATDYGAVKLINHFNNKSN
jgi:hypothetical protein